jgi:hypothetical protein
MRARYQASNHDIAEVLSDHAKNLPYSERPAVFSGSLLKEWGNPQKLSQLTTEHLKVMYDLFLRRQLVPTSSTGWFGLLSVHHHLTGDSGNSLPAYLHDAGLPGWIHLYNQPRKESA